MLTVPLLVNVADAVPAAAMACWLMPTSTVAEAEASPDAALASAEPRIVSVPVELLVSASDALPVPTTCANCKIPVATEPLAKACVPPFATASAVMVSAPLLVSVFAAVPFPLATADWEIAGSLCAVALAESAATALALAAIVNVPVLDRLLVAMPPAPAAVADWPIAFEMRAKAKALLPVPAVVPVEVALALARIVSDPLLVSVLVALPLADRAF